jgi:RNA polymerase sigma factor (sigma-70 family)
MTSSFSNCSDEQLIHQIIRHPDEQSLWSQLFERYQRQFYARAYRTCNHNEADAKDLLQKIQLAVVEAVPRYKGRSSVSTYLFRIASNVCAQWLKQVRREEGLYAHSTKDVGASDLLENMPSSVELPSVSSYRNEAIERVVTVRQGLKPKHDELIRLFFLENCSHADIAVRLGFASAGASRKHLCQAISALRALCEKHHITAEDFREGIGNWYDEMPE